MAEFTRDGKKIINPNDPKQFANFLREVATNVEAGEVICMDLEVHGNLLHLTLLGNGPSRHRDAPNATN